MCTYLSGEHERLLVDALFEHGRRLIGHVLLHYLETKRAKRITAKTIGMFQRMHPISVDNYQYIMWVI